MLQRPQKKTRWPIWLKAIWLVIGLGVGGLWGAVLFGRMHAREGALHDFVQEWTSARSHLKGEPVYGDLRETIPRYLGQPYDDVVHVNAHPPTSILLVVPFGSMPYAKAYFLWNCLSIVALSLSILLMTREVRASYWSVIPIGCLLLVSNSLAQQVNQGQLNLILLLLLTSSWMLWRREQMMFAGAIVGLCAAIKVFPAFLVVLFLARRRWDACLGFVAGLGLATAATVAVLGLETYQDYVMKVAPQVSVFRDYWPNASIVGFWSKLFDPQSGHVRPITELPLLARIASAVTILTMSGLLIRRASNAQTREDIDSSWAAGFVGMILASPIAWDHYFVLLIPCLVIQWPRSTTSGKSLLLLLSIGLLVVYPKWIWDATIPGDGELAFLPGMTQSIATPLQSLTVLSYQFYLLVVWFLLSLTYIPLPEPQSVPAEVAADA